MATANVARDLDVLRQAVGDRRLSYVGFSYGSFLGVTYANLFPGRVRAVVVDGVLDPIAWTTGRGDEAETQPFSTRVRSDAGAQATLDEFFRLCDEAGPAGCAFAGDSALRFAALRRAAARRADRDHRSGDGRDVPVHLRRPDRRGAGRDVRLPDLAGLRRVPFVCRGLRGPSRSRQGAAGLHPRRRP